MFALTLLSLRQPENLLSAGSDENEIIKIADFGFSKNFGEEKLMTSCGSPGYVGMLYIFGEVISQPPISECVNSDVFRLLLQPLRSSLASLTTSLLICGLSVSFSTFCK